MDAAKVAKNQFIGVEVFDNDPAKCTVLFGRPGSAFVQVVNGVLIVEVYEVVDVEGLDDIEQIGCFDGNNDVNESWYL